jgi:hypothetical protein
VAYGVLSHVPSRRAKLGHSRSVAIPRATCHLLAGQPKARRSPLTTGQPRCAGYRLFKPLQPRRSGGVLGAQLGHLRLLVLQFVQHQGNERLLLDRLDLTGGAAGD